jgi:hypothetical protein
MSFDHLVGGAVYGASLAFVAIAVPRYTRQVLAAALAVAALVYVPFALAADAGAARVAVELAGVGIFGYAALRGTCGSAWWLVAGLTLHAVWSAAPHLASPGGSFAPEWYATSCLTFELAAAAVAAIAIVIGTQLTDAPCETSARTVGSLRHASACTCTVCPAMGACAA